MHSMFGFVFLMYQLGNPKINAFHVWIRVLDVAVREPPRHGDITIIAVDFVSQDDNDILTEANGIAKRSRPRRAIWISVIVEWTLDRLHFEGSTFCLRKRLHSEPLYVIMISAQD